MGQGICLAGSLQGQSHCPLMPPTSSPICCSVEQLSTHGCHHAAMPMRVGRAKESTHCPAAQVPVCSLEPGPPVLAGLKKQTNPTWAGRGQGHWERTALHPRSYLMKREMPHWDRFLKLEGNLDSCLVSAFLIKSPQKHVVCYFSILCMEGMITAGVNCYN